MTQAPTIDTKLVRVIGKKWHKDQPFKRKFVLLLFPENEKASEETAKALLLFLKKEGVSPKSIENLAQDALSEHAHIFSLACNSLSCLIAAAAGYVIAQFDNSQISVPYALPLLCLLLGSFALTQMPKRTNRYIQILLKDIHIARENGYLSPFS